MTKDEKNRRCLACESEVDHNGQLLICIDCLGLECSEFEQLSEEVPDEPTNTIE